MPHHLMKSLSELRRDLSEGRCTARSLVDAALLRIEAVDDPHSPVFLAQYPESARAAAEQVDRARHAGEQLPAFAGIPFAVKDLFDVRGQVTTAGSTVLGTEAPAAEHAAVIQQLLTAGFILIGKTNMTEFAFSGLGLNPHYGTPPAWGTADDKACAPGGSSSGAGVSVAAGMVPLSLGTDTAGSCRIPAAWNGVVGYKPTQSSLSGRGAFPLSPLFDAPGPLTRRVACCHSAYRLMSGLEPIDIEAAALSDLRFALPKGLPMQDLDPQVAECFYQAVDHLRSAGAQIEAIDVPEFETAGEIFRSAPMATYEAWHIHRQRLTEHRARYDPFVAMRVSSGEHISEHTQAQNLATRSAAVSSYGQRLQGFDALLMPTTAIEPPLIAPLQYDLELFAATNGRALRNTSLSNFVDGCALSLPCNAAEQAAVGISLCHANGEDDRVFRAAAAVEAALATLTAQAP